MGAQFRAMTADDYVDLGSYVKTTGTSDTFGLLSDGLDSSLLFGEEAVSTALCSSLDRSHKRAAIQLVKPTFNYVLARSSASLLKKILGVPTKLWGSILDMTTVYDLDEDRLVSFDEMDKNGRCLMGAEIAEKMIVDFDIEKATQKCIEDMVLFECKDTVRDISKLGEVVRGSGQYLLVGDYYLNITNKIDPNEQFKRGHNIDTLLKNIRDVHLASSDSRITYLLNIPRDKSSLFGMLTYQLSVVPSEMRPKVQRREHKLTTRYTSVLTANNELRAITSASSNMTEVREKYLLLDKVVSKLQYKNVGTKSKSVAPDDTSIMERVKSKKGQIRNRNLGKRQDNSFRSVVTVSPYLPLDMIEIPACILPSLFELHVLPYLAAKIEENNNNKREGEIYSTLYDKIKMTNLQSADAQKEIIKILDEHKILQNTPIFFGRQPTLHKHGIQGFYVKVIEGKAIGVNPLICPAYNMDFDGDTGYGKGAHRRKAIQEVKDLILTTQNLYLAKTGECTIAPRQEMIYGLYTCTRNHYKVGNPVASFTSFEEVRQEVIKHHIKVWDTVTVAGGSFIAGEIAVIACFPVGMVVPSSIEPKFGQMRICEITSKTIDKYIDKLLERNENGDLLHPLGTRYASNETFVGAINRLVETGFRVAYFYTPSVSLLQETRDIPEYDDALTKFYADMEPYDKVYDMGLETKDNYTIAFDKCLRSLMNKYTDNIYDKLGPENGYVLMAQSGTRGKKENLTQMFSVKGRVKKNDTEVFDTLLSHGYVEQLTPMEANIAAYGGRQGQIDKSLRTGDTGYASRKMWHATQGIWITENDCGTTDGITVTKNFMTKFLDTDSSTYMEDLRNMFAHAIVGHTEVGGKIITDDMAKQYAADDSIQAVKIRSPLTCKNPCCSKCYGLNWETHKRAVPGANVGVIAAQSIGELMSQLTLNQFHKGGVAEAGQTTSAFDKVDSYIHVANLAKASAKGKYAGYDPLAWADGPVTVTPGNNVRENIVKIGKDSKKRITVPSSLQLKEYAKKGEGLSYKHGDYDLHEVIEYCGIEEAQLYAVYKLYSLYKSECDVCTIHFEVLVASMTRYMIISAGNTDMKVGQYYTRKELMQQGNDTVVYEARLLSVKELPLVSQEALDCILMENHCEGLSRVCALELSDTLTKPLNRMMLGLTIKTGTAMPNYISERKESV